MAFFDWLSLVLGTFGALGLLGFIASLRRSESPQQVRRAWELAEASLLSVVVAGVVLVLLGSDLSWDMVVRMLAGAVAVAVPVIGLYLGRWLPGRIWRAVRERWTNRRRRGRTKAGERRVRVRARHDRVREAWGEYQIDLEQFLAAPALNDVTVPSTASFVRAMARAQDLEGQARTEPEAYAEAVYALEIAWSQAWTYASRVGADYLSDPGRFHRAAGLLRLAQGEHEQGEAEREQALLKARGLLKGLVELPRPVVGALEERVRTAISD